MRESSARAASKPARGGLTNALFLAGTAEELPWLLRGRVDELVVALPWGALLRGVLEPASASAEGIRACLRPAGQLALLLSLEPRDAAAGEAVLDADRIAALVRAYAAAGLECVELRPAGADDVARLSGAWGRRLGIPDRRSACLLCLRLSSVRACPRPVAP